MDEITYTHKGWFGLCPVYIEIENPMWPMRVTGELEDPIVVEYER